MYSRLGRSFIYHEGLLTHTPEHFLGAYVSAENSAHLADAALTLR